MSIVITDPINYTNIANSIRAKNGLSTVYKPAEMSAAIDALNVSGVINLQDKTVNPSTSQQSLSADTGYDGLGVVTINAMPSGTAGTPVATKGTVSNNSISVTPSVTNTTGYITGGTKTGTAVTVSASELVSGTKTISSNGTNIDVTNYASVDVSVSGGGGSATIESLSVTPTETAQTFNSSSVDGYKPVTVGAISSTYVGSGITQRDSDDLTVSGATVTVPAGYYAQQETKTIDLTTVTVTPTNTTQVIAPSDEYYLNIENMAPSSGSGMGVGSIWNISWSSQLNAGETYHITLDFYRAGYARHYAYDNDITFNGFPFNITANSTSSSHTATMKFNTTQISNTLSGDEDNITANRLTVSVFKESTAIGFSQVTVNGDADLLSSNIRKGVNIFGVAGTYEAGSTPTYQTKTVSPTESQQTVSPDSGYDALSSVTVNAISSTYVGTGITRRSSTDLTSSGATVSVPAGYYAAAASKSIANGSATGPSSLSGSSATITTGTNTITLTKTGVTTTPTVSAGYVSSATASTATVALTASVTVNPTPTDSGATVTIPAGYYSTQTTKSVSSGSATAPASISGTSATVSTGTNTLTLTKTVSVTPSVSAGYISSGTAGNSSVSLTASVTTKAAATITPGTSNQTISSGTYLTGTQTIAGDADLVAGNIKSGVQIFGVTGSYSGIDTSDATAAATDIVTGKTAYVDGRKVEGSLVIQKYYTGSSAPASSFGNNGDIYFQN